MSTIEILTVAKQLPVFITDISEHRDIIETAKLAISQERDKDPKPMESNVKAQYVSGYSSHITNPNFGPIVDLTISCVKFVCSNYFKTDLDFICYNCWGAHYKAGDHTIPHSHFPSEFAAVAYLDVKEGAAPLVFEDLLTVQPRSGMLVVFPGILQHHVPATSADRLLVAMNIERKKE